MATADDSHVPPEQSTARGIQTAHDLERQAERMHEVAAAAHDQVAAFADQVMQREPNVATRTGIDGDRYRERAAAERARAQQVRDRLAASESPEDSSSSPDS